MGSLAAGGGAAMGVPAKARLADVQRLKDQFTEIARRAMVACTRRRAVRQNLHQFTRDHAIDKARSTAYAADAPAVTFINQLTRLWRAGANLTELTQLATVPMRAVLALAGAAPRDLDHIDLEEQRLDGEEDQLQMRRRVHPHTPAGLREEAAVCAMGAALFQERERALIVRAELLEQTRGLVA
ncbi:MAG: hypothetical protein ACYC0B_02215 [Gemmatimonadaceae bacterium]